MSDGSSSSARQSASHDKDYSGYHASSKSTASATDNKAGRVGKRQRHVNDDDSMDRCAVHGVYRYCSTPFRCPEYSVVGSPFSSTALTEWWCVAQSHMHCCIRRLHIVLRSTTVLYMYMC